MLSSFRFDRLRTRAFALVFLTFSLWLALASAAGSAVISRGGPGGVIGIPGHAANQVSTTRTIP